MLDKLLSEKKILIRFICVGAAGFIFNYLILKVCVTSVGMNRIIGEVIAAALALQLTFFLHDRWTYVAHIKGFNLSLRTRYGRYIISNSFGSVMTVILFALFSIVLNHFIALATSAIVAMMWNFIVNKLVIWKHVPDGSQSRTT